MAARLNTTLLVMDETECRETDVFALVALVVPIEKVDTIRLGLHRFMRELEGVPDRTISPPPELHGSKMLGDVAWATEAHRIKCFAHVVEVVNQLRIEVLRAAYYNKSLEPLRKGFEPAAREKLYRGFRYSACFGGLERSVGSLLAESYVIPVMDGLDDKIAFPVGGSKPILHAMRAAPGYAEGQISIANVQNLLDPVFVDSRYSSIMQVADVTAYLPHMLDWERLTLPMSDFKASVAGVANTLDASLVHGAEPIWMQTA
jgi:hypothetical protein